MDVSESKSEKDTVQSRGILSIEGLNPFDSNWRDDCMESLVDFKVPTTYLIEEIFDVTIREKFEIVLNMLFVTLMSPDKVLQVGAVSMAERRNSYCMKLSW